MNSDFISNYSDRSTRHPPPEWWADDDDDLPPPAAPRQRAATGASRGARPRPYRDRRPRSPLRRAYSERGRSEYITDAPFSPEPGTAPVQPGTPTITRRRWFAALCKITLVEGLGVIFVAMVASGNQVMMTVGVVGLILDVPLAYVLVPVKWFLPFLGRTSEPRVAQPSPTAIPWGRPPLTSQEGWHESEKARRGDRFAYGGAV